MGNIYRKASIDRLASPEQLDKMIQIASPSLWIAVVGAGIIVISVLCWAIFGRLPENVSISGLYMANSETQGAYATYGGKVTEVMVSKNQKVEAGDVLAVITNEESDLTVTQLEERIQAVEAVTLTSKNDQATSDNSKLLEYKLQYQQVGMTLEQKEETLKALKEQLETVKAQVKTYRANMDAAEEAYLAAVGNDGINSASFNYQTAQAEYQTAQSEYQAVYSSVSSLESNYASAQSSLQSTSDQYTTLEGQYEALQTQYDSQWNELQMSQEQYTQLTEEYAGQEIPEYVQQQLAQLENTITALQSSVESISGELSSISQNMSQLEASIQTQGSQVSQLADQLSAAKAQLSSAEGALASAKASYESAQNVYGAYYSSQNQRSANQTRLNTAFSEASTLYSNAYSQQQSIEQQIKDLTLENSFEVQNKDVNAETLQAQFEASKEAILKDLNSQLDSYYENGQQEEIIAAASGTVVDVAVEKNQIVGQGTTVVKIKSDAYQEGDKEIIRSYVPLADGKKLSEGMDVVVTPSTVDEQEYGHMTAQVISVGTYTVSSAEMLQVLGDETMVQSFQQQGPCVEVIISLDKDETTASGYAWSNKKGNTVNLEENTLVSAKVRIKEDAPMTKIIPFIKEKLEVNVESKETGN